MIAKELIEEVKMCDESGKLNSDSIGWARHPVVQCNLSGSYLRKKKWNYWCVTSPDILFSATISHLDYAAVMFVYILDFKTLSFHEKTLLVPLGKGCQMPKEVNASVIFEGKEMFISFEQLEEGTRIQVKCPNFSGKDELLYADIVVEKPKDYESLNVVVPWNQKRYQFTSKQPALPATGTVQWNNKTYTINKNSAFGCLDFGRGVWPYRSTWNWASASGIINGKKIGLNFGGQWTDGTGQNENGIIVDGRLHKIHEDVLWEYNTQNYMEPWVLKTTKSNQVFLTFEPIFERKAKTNAVIINSEVHQMIGRFKGYVITDEDERIEIDSLLGWAEDHKASW